MDLAKTIKGIQLIGPRNALLAVVYAARRDALEKRFPAPRPASAEYHPVGSLQQFALAAAGGRFQFGTAELEVVFLRADLVRLTWAPGSLPVPYAIARTDWPRVEVARTQINSEHVLETPRLRLKVKADGSVELTDGRGQLLRRELPPGFNGLGWEHRCPLAAGEHLYGLGERSGPLNLRGRKLRLWNTERGGVYLPGDDPMYKCLPVYCGVHAAGSYLVFYENTFPGMAEMGDAAVLSFEAGALRYYLMPGPLPRAMECFTDLTGRAALPPRWALGFHHSKVAYRTEADVRALVADLRRLDLPFSVIHMDLDFMDGFRTFSLDRQRFPDLAGLAQDLERTGAKLVLIVDTAVKKDPAYNVYREGLRAGAFCTDPEGAVAEAPVWPGVSVFPDFTNPRTREWWAQYYQPYLDLGVAGIWHDMNEPATFFAWGEPTLPLPTRHDLEGRGADHREAHNVYGLQMNRAGFEALRRLRPERRPWLLSRSGWVGLPRYAWTWTGDPASTWGNLKATVATVLGCALSGLPYTGPDIGGFNGFPSNELFVRWFQLASFLPFFRVHAAFSTPRHLPYTLTEAELEFVRGCLRRRYELMPYLYTLAWECSRTGAPPVRPVFWHDSDPGLWGVEDEFLLGASLLVAPILEQGAEAREVVFPAGAWYDWDGHVVCRGPGHVSVAAPLDQIPFFVRDGSLIPVEYADSLGLRLYAPVNGGSESAVYCDAGDGYGPALTSQFSLRRAENRVEVDWQQTGNFPFPYRHVDLQILGASAETATVDGARLPVSNGHLMLDRPFRQLVMDLPR